MNDRMRGKLAILLAALFFSSGTILTKWLSNTYNPFFLTLTDFAVGIVAILAWFVIRRRKPVIRDWKYLIVRGAVGAVCTLLFFLALKLGNNGRTTLLNMTYPLFAAVFGFLLFKEKLSVYHFISLAVCFVGVLFVFNDGNKLSNIGDFVAILSGVFGGFVVHYIKKSRTNNEPLVVYLALCAFGFIFSLPFAFMGDITTVSPSIALILAGKGFMYLIAQTLVSYAYQFVTATTASIMAYSNIPLTLAMSVLIAHEKMNGRFAIGAGLIVSGLLITTLTTGEKPKDKLPESSE